MISEDVVEVADRWWARHLACERAALRPSTPRVRQHAGALAGDAGIWILVVGASPLISLPPALWQPLREQAEHWSSLLVADAQRLTAALEPFTVERIVGPSYIGYGTNATLHLFPAMDARDLTPGDAAAVESLRDACPPEEWRHCASDPAAGPAFGAFDESGALAALAGYQALGRTIAHLSAITAPEKRNRGLATAAVARASRHALGAGLLPQYRTPESNAPAMEIARQLGFQEYGFSVYVTLRDH